MQPLKRLFACGILLTSAPLAHAEDKFRPQFELETTAMGHNGRFAAIPKYMVPLTQSSDSMLYTDIRTRLDNRDSQEINIALGYRQMVSSNWIFGGYASFDYMNSSFDNSFVQATLGAEALSHNWEFRSNIYLPESSEKRTGTGTLVLSGTTFGLQGGFERALPGVDGEVSYRIPIPTVDDLRIYSGGYYYDAEDYATVAGPRFRAEWTLDASELELLDDGKELTFGGGWQHDSVRGDQAFALLELRIPFGLSGKKSVVGTFNLSQYLLLIEKLIKQTFS
jgi:hypothetical protein